MAVISISRGSYHRGREVAHLVAEKLRYECISRDSLLANSEEYDIPEIKLLPNVQHAAQVLERFSFGRERFINFMASSLLRFLKKDNHVYHGLAGQFFLPEVTHVIKVRIMADMGERVVAESERSGLSEHAARKQLQHDDEERRKWAMLLHGIDIHDPVNYDMVLNISTMGVEDAANIVAQAASFPCYQATDESSRLIHDLALKSEVKAALFDFPQAGVFVHNGDVRIQLKAPEEQKNAIRERIQAAITGLDGLRSADIQVSQYY